MDAPDVDDGGEAMRDQLAARKRRAATPFAFGLFFSC
jgi:hypothetical protein